MSSVRSLLLGLDVSPKRLGWGLVDLLTGEPVACGCESIDLPDHGWMHQQVQTALTTVTRHMTAPGDGSARIDGYVIRKLVGEIQAVYVEDTAQAGKYRQHDAGRAQGIVQAEVERRWPWAPVQFLKPSEWKKLAGLKGNAGKHEVYEVAIKVHQPVGMQDAADALLIAVAGQRRNNENWERGADAA